jgi:hypothetical protein
MLDREQPRRKGVLQEQAVGGAGFAGLGQDRQQVAHTDKSGRKMPVLGLDVFFQELRGFGPEILRQQFKFEGHHVIALGVALNAPIRGDVTLVESRLDVLKQFLIFGGFVGASKSLAGSRQQVCGIGKKGGANQLLGRIGADGKPVAIVIAAILVANETGAVQAQIIHPLLHRRKLAFQNALVAINFVNGPGADDPGIAPGGSTAPDHGVRDDLAERPPPPTGRHPHPPAIC